MLELEMMDDSYNYLLAQQQFKVVKKEIPFLSRCIDIVLVDEDDDIISIEFKIDKWRHAIEQAINHKLGADKAYICLPKRKLTRTLLQALQESGVGLLFYDKDDDKVISEVVQALDEPANVPAFKNMLIEQLKRIN